jgi:acyl carrier protein
MDRIQILEFINEAIEDEHGEPATEDTKIIGTGLDSFGITMVLLAVDQKYDVYSKEEFSNLDIPNLVVRDIIDKVMEKTNGTD